MNNVHLYPFSDANRADTENTTVCQTVNSFPSTATWKATHQIVACSLSFQALPPSPALCSHSCYMQPSRASPFSGQPCWCAEPLRAQQPKFKIDIETTACVGQLLDSVRWISYRVWIWNSSKEMYKQIQTDSSCPLYVTQSNNLYWQIS